jgi:hypothetical protein
VRRAASLGGYELAECTRNSFVVAGDQNGIAIAFAPDVDVLAAQNREDPLSLGIRQRAANPAHETGHRRGGDVPVVMAANVIQKIPVKAGGRAPGRSSDPLGQVVQKQLQLVPEYQQLGQATLDLKETLLGNADDSLPRHALSASAREYQSDVFQREPESLGASDKQKSVFGLRSVKTVPAAGASQGT